MKGMIKIYFAKIFQKYFSMTKKYQLQNQASRGL